MKKRLAKKLMLSRETLVDLNQSSLKDAVGAASVGSFCCSIGECTETCREPSYCFTICPTE